MSVKNIIGNVFAITIRIIFIIPNDRRVNQKLINRNDDRLLSRYLTHLKIGIGQLL